MQLLRGIFRAIADIEPHVQGTGSERWKQPICDDLTERFNFKLKHWKDIRSLVSGGKLRMQSDARRKEVDQASRVATLDDPNSKSKRVVTPAGVARRKKVDQASRVATSDYTNSNNKRIATPADGGRNVHRAMHNPIVLSLDPPKDKLANTPTPVVHDGRLTVRYAGDARRGWFFRGVAETAFANYESKNRSQPEMGIEALLLLSKAGEAFSQALQAQILCTRSSVVAQCSQRLDKQQQYELEAALIDTAQAISYLYHALGSVCMCGQLYCGECTDRHQNGRAKKTNGKSTSRDAPFAHHGQQGWWGISPRDQHVGIVDVHGLPSFSTDRMNGYPKQMANRWSCHVPKTHHSPRPPASARPAGTRVHADYRKINSSRRSINARHRAAAHVGDYTVPSTDTAAYSTDARVRTKLGSTGVYMPLPQPTAEVAVTVQVSKPPWLQLGMAEHGWTPEMILAQSTTAHFQWIQAEAATKLSELKMMSQSPDSKIDPIARALVKQASDETAQRAVHSSNAVSSAAGPRQHNLQEQAAPNKMPADHGARKQQAIVDTLDVDINRTGSQAAVDEVDHLEPSRGATETVMADIVLNTKPDRTNTGKLKERQHYVAHSPTSLTSASDQRDPEPVERWQDDETQATQMAAHSYFRDDGTTNPRRGGEAMLGSAEIEKKACGVPIPDRHATTSIIQDGLTPRTSASGQHDSEPVERWRDDQTQATQMIALSPANEIGASICDGSKLCAQDTVACGNVRAKHRRLRVWSGSAQLAWPISPVSSADCTTETVVVRTASACSMAQQLQPLHLAATEQIFTNMRRQI